MDKKIKEMVEKYQCPGCVCGSNISCYKKGYGVECDEHVAGTRVMPFVGRIFLGLPKGFCRLGNCDDTKINIFKDFNQFYNKLNVPIWKFLDKHGNTLVRWISPRVNYSGIHIFMGDQMAKIDCLEITQKDIDGMD